MPRKEEDEAEACLSWLACHLDLSFQSLGKECEVIICLPPLVIHLLTPLSKEIAFTQAANNCFIP